MTVTFLKNLALSLSLAIFSPLSFANKANVTGSGADTSLGDAAGSITTLMSSAHGIIEIIFIFCAIAMATSAFLKYRLHRRNPQQVPLSTPVMEAVIAVVLLAIPYLIDHSSSSKAVEQAKPVTNTKYYHLPPGQSHGQNTPPPAASPYPH